MKTNILLDQMHVMDRNQESLSAPLYSMTMCSFFPRATSTGLDAQIPARCRDYYGRHNRLSEIRKIIERHIGVKDIARRGLVGQDDDDLVCARSACPVWLLMVAMERT